MPSCVKVLVGRPSSILPSSLLFCESLGGTLVYFAASLFFFLLGEVCRQMRGSQRFHELRAMRHRQHGVSQAWSGDSPPIFGDNVATRMRGLQSCRVNLVFSYAKFGPEVEIRMGSWCGGAFVVQMTIHTGKVNEAEEFRLGNLRHARHQGDRGVTVYLLCR